MITVNDERVTTPQPYSLVLAGNIAAIRIRLRLKQRDLAERMRALGWSKWSKQSVSELEADKRAIRAEELLALSIALETTVRVLTTAPVGTTAVKLPEGQPVGAQRIVAPDGTFTWDGNRLKVSPSGRPSPATLDALIAEHRREAAEHLREAEELEAYRDYLARGAPGTAAGESAAEDIPVRRPGESPEG
jgi:transcriptional regulator with XRE-family HTH domain